MARQRAHQDEGGGLGFAVDELMIFGALGFLAYGAWIWIQQNGTTSGASTAPAIGDDPSADDSTAPASSSTSNVTYLAPPANTSPAAQIQPGQFAVSAAGAAFIKNQEGFRSTPYGDAGRGRDIGYGHQIRPGENLSRIDTAGAEQLLEQDLANVDAALNRLVMVPLTQGQVDAIGDLIYDTGEENFASSTLLKDLNAGNYAAAQTELGRWTYAGGRQLSALVKRRQTAQQIFGSA